MQDNIGPEERLLRLIRKDTDRLTKKEELAEDIKTLAKKRPGRRFSLSAIFNLSKMRMSFSFNLVNRLLFIAFLIMGIYLSVDFLIAGPHKIEGEIPAFGELDNAALEIPAVSPSSLEPVSYYTQTVKSRNLFIASDSNSKTDQALSSPTPPFMEMVSKLRLQGIISGSNPQAIIEDTKTEKVYFLSPGDRIGEIELKQILSGEVRLNYYGQEAKLAL